MTLISLQRLCYLILLTSIAFTVQVISHDSQSFWFVLAVLLLSLLTLGYSFVFRIIVVGTTGIFLISTIEIFAHLNNFFLLKAISILFFIFIIIYFSQRKKIWILPAYIIITLTLLSLSLPLKQHEFLTPSGWIALGTLFVILLQFIFVYHFSLNQWREWLILSLRWMRKLNNDLFACLLEKEYSKNFYLFEHRVHNQKIKFLKSVMHLRDIYLVMQESKPNSQQFNLILAKLDELFALILECGQLRFRITDFTVFNICHNELEAIRKEIQNSFNILLQVIHNKKNKKTKFDAYELEASINNLEMNYVNVLQVAAREPLSFILFISSLKMLQKKITELHLLLATNGK